MATIINLSKEDIAKKELKKEAALLVDASTTDEMRDEISHKLSKHIEKAYLTGYQSGYLRGTLTTSVTHLFIFVGGIMITYLILGYGKKNG